MAIKQGDKNYLEAHSKAKLEFLEEYLNSFLMVLMLDKYTNIINIFDIFCGIGIYKQDGSRGSPIIIADLIKLNSKKYNKNTMINLFINDIDRQKVEFVSEYINKNYKKIFNFKSFSLDAKNIISEIKKLKLSNEVKNFIFIDPHGYKDIYKKDIYELMNIGKTEILIFLPIYDMYRFLEPTKEDKENSSYRHIKRIMEEFELEYDVNSVEEYIDNIENAFSFNGEFYSTSLKLEKNKKGNVYALFFITKNLYGFEKAIDAKWKVDEVCGNKFEIQETNLFSEQFNDESNQKCLKNLKNKLINFLQEDRTNNEVYEFTLINGYLPKQSNNILRDLQNKDKLEFDRKVRKNSFYLNYDNYKKSIIKYKVRIK